MAWSGMKTAERVPGFEKMTDEPEATGFFGGNEQESKRDKQQKKEKEYFINRIL
jgi:hypothetical protein